MLHRLQEVPEEVPVGHTPRQIPVILRGEITRKCGPGDVVTLSGIFLPSPHVSPCSPAPVPGH